MFFKVAILVLKKDLAIEARSREILYTTLFFAISCLLIFSVAFVKEGVPAEDAASGILWIALTFSGTLALGRTFERERYGETLRALLMAPACWAASNWDVAEVPENTLVIHGEVDDTVPIASVYDWARPQELPVVVIPGGEHFFHRKLHILKRVIVDRWTAERALEELGAATAAR